MSKKTIIPPYVSSPDNIRCGQSVILMILKHFMPDKEWDFADADKICGYVEGKWTWTTVFILGMLHKGFDVVSHSSFDKERFIAAPNEYLLERFGEAKTKMTLEHTDMDSMIAAEKQALTETDYQWIRRDWQWHDVKELLDQGYLLYAWVNARKLYCRNEDSVSGHAILVFDYDEEMGSVTFHDPGGFGPLSDETRIHLGAWQAGRVGTNHFMAAAKNIGAEGGSSLVGFRPRKGKK
jgi:hypothetical protein